MTNPTGTGIAGQEGLTDGNSDFNAISSMIDAALGRIATMKLVKVEAVTPGADGLSGTVDVLPLVNVMDGLGQSSKLATVYGVPYLRIQGGKNAVVIDPAVGDIGIMIVADRDISAAVAAKGQANPGSFRRFNMADGIYIGGICNAVPEQLVTFGEDTITVTDKTGNKIEMKPTGIDLTPNTGLPVRVNGILIVTENLQIAGTIKGVDGGTYLESIATEGDVVAGGGVSLTGHTHTQPNDSHGDTEQPTNPPT